MRPALSVASSTKIEKGLQPISSNSCFLHIGMRTLFTTAVHFVLARCADWTSSCLKQLFKHFTRHVLNAMFPCIARCMAILASITAVCEHCVTDVEEVEGTCYRCIKISLSRNLKYIKTFFNLVIFFFLATQKFKVYSFCI